MGEADRLQTALEEKEKNYSRFIGEVKLKNSELSSLISVDPPSCSQIQSLMDPDVELLEYYTTNEKIYAWLVSREDIRVYEIGATETTAKLRASDFNLIQFATHGEFNERQPMQSGLLLTRDNANDGYLQVHEVFEMDLKNANLVTLSACETALSKIEGGDDLVGLSRGFIYAGTPSILATLWKVDDASTSKLMEIFYRNWKSGMSKAEALREAQEAVRRMKGYEHPYYWAPFIMIGDWK